MTKHRWEFLDRVKRGHTYWRDYDSQRVAIADNSGSGRPGETEDTAILWLDTSRPITWGASGCGALAPVVTDGGESLSVPCGAAELIYLVGQGMQVCVIDQDGESITLIDSRLLETPAAEVPAESDVAHV